MPQNYILLRSVTLNANANSVSFTNIPQTGYTDLKIVMSSRTTRTAGSVPYDPVSVNFNLASSGFSTKLLYGDGSGAASVTSSLTSDVDWFYATAVAAAGNTFGNSEMFISNYNSLAPKSISIQSTGENSTQSVINSFTRGIWNPGTPASISSIYFTLASGASFIEGSSFTLYGLSALGTTPALPKAAGGDVIANDGTYWYHAFKSSGTFTVNTALTNVDFLVVAGGGGAGGGNTGSGGGGAGGLRTSAGTSGGGASAESKLSLSVGSYPVVVGGGGNGGMFYNPGSTQVSGTNGSNSSFHTITSIGGGVGGGFSMAPAGPGIAGGSGGGGGGEFLGSANPGGAGTANQGYAGGAGFTDNATYRSFGGGGGAGAVGASGGTGNNGGAGGAGVQLTAMSTATYTGVSGYYAGGGGGSNGANVGAGGAGGGGAGGGNNGVANTGGGGGGANSATTQTGRFTGHGGSGIVIIKYAMA